MTLDPSYSLSHLPLAEIEIRTIKNVNLKGGTVLDGFPRGGFTNSIASMCFMRSSKNDLVAIFDSLAFPPIISDLQWDAKLPR